MTDDTTPEMKSAADQYISTIAPTKDAVGVSYRGDKSMLPAAI